MKNWRKIKIIRKSLVGIYCNLAHLESIPCTIVYLKDFSNARGSPFDVCGFLKTKKTFVKLKDLIDLFYDREIYENIRPICLITSCKRRHTILHECFK